VLLFVEYQSDPAELPRCVKKQQVALSFLPGQHARLSDEPAEFLRVLDAVGHEGELVGGVELDQAAGRWLLAQHFRPAVVGEHARQRPRAAACR
jgi:hypothetical protein